MTASMGLIFPLYIHIENFKNLLVRNLWTDFNINDGPLRPLIILSQSVFLIQVVDMKWQTVQIQISWQELQKPTDLVLHSLQRHGISGFSRTRVKCLWVFGNLLYSFWDILNFDLRIVDTQKIWDMEHHNLFWDTATSNFGLFWGIYFEIRDIDIPLYKPRECTPIHADIGHYCYLMHLILEREATSSQLFMPPFFEKAATLKGNNLRQGRKFFFWRRPLSEGALYAGKQKGSHKSCLPWKKWQKIYQADPVSLFPVTAQLSY